MLVENGRRRVRDRRSSPPSKRPVARRRDRWPRAFWVAASGAVVTACVGKTGSTGAAAEVETVAALQR